MRIGIPRETKDGERRVALTPDGARLLVGDGHQVIVGEGAGAAVGCNDADYRHAGAAVTADAAAVWACELVVKVKELQPQEFAGLVPRTTIFGYAQLARDPTLLQAVVDAGVRYIAFETVRSADGTLPLLAPMSRIAGRLAPFAGAWALGTDRGGSGVLLPGVDDVPGANVLVFGAGSAGGQAARVAAAMGGRVVVISRSAGRLARLADDWPLASPLTTCISGAMSDGEFAAAIVAADLIIGAVLDPGRLSPKLISREHLRAMRPGSAIVDIGIDQGGIAESSRITSLSAPTYVDERIVHYAVPNMPALVARTATLALATATLPFVRRLAGAGIGAALAGDTALAAGVMAWEGAVIDARLAGDTGRPVAAVPWRR